MEYSPATCPLLGVRDPRTAAILALLMRVLHELYFLKSNSLSLISKESLAQIWIPAGEDGGTLLAMNSAHAIAYEEGSISGQLLQLYSEESRKEGLAKNIMATRCSQFSNQTNYLHYEIARRCKIRGLKFFPVFDMSSRTGSPCIAVLELVTTRADPDFGIEEYKEIKIELQKVGFTTSNNAEYFFEAEQGPSLAAQGLEGEPNLLGRPITRKRVNSDCQFHEATQDHNRLNKDFAKSPICRKFTVGSSSTAKTPIVSARRKHPDIGKITRIFGFKSSFTIQGLRRSIENMFNWDDNAGTNFCLYSVNNQGHRCPNSINSDEHVMELFGTCKLGEPLIFVIDVVLLHELLDVGLCTYQGVELDINEDGFKMADEAVHNELKKGDKNKRMAIIIGACVNTVKNKRKKFRSSPIVINAPSTLQYDFGNGKAGWHTRMRTGEFSSTLDIMSQGYSAIGVAANWQMEMEGNEHLANINGIPGPVGFNNGIDRELEATAPEQEAENNNWEDFPEDVQFGKKDLDLLDEPGNMPSSVVLEATAEQQPHLEFASQVPQGMGYALEQQLGEATAWSDRKSDDDSFMDFCRSLEDL